MGIPGLNSYLRKEYPEAFVKGSLPWQTAHLYFDLNFVLHQCAGRRDISAASLTEEDVHAFAQDVLTAMLWYIDTLCDQGLEAASITVCMDGPPSVMKFAEQRDRRRSKLSAKADEDISGDDLVSLALTPGTDFMESLSELLLRLIEDAGWSEKLVLPLTLLDAGTPGEGEHKIAKAILESDRREGPSKHVIIGGDADLTVIAVTLVGGMHGDVGVFSEDLFVASKLARAINLFPPQIKATPLARGSLSECMPKGRDGSQHVLTSFRPQAADFAFLSLLGGNDYLAPAVKRPKSGAKSHMDWLLSRYTLARQSFMTAKRSDASGRGCLWEFRIGKPEVISRILWGDDPLPSSAKRLADEEISECEDFILGVLWIVSTFANGIVPSYLSACAAKMSSWRLVEYLCAEPDRARSLSVAYSSDQDLPLSPLTVAACVLPWRGPVFRLLGDASSALLELIQAEFADMYEFETRQDSRQLQWRRENKWANDVSTEKPLGLAFRDMRDFDMKVKALLDVPQQKVCFSDAKVVQLDGGRKRSAPASEEPRPAKRQNADKFDYQAVQQFGERSVGDLVEAFWPEDDVWLPAILLAVHSSRCRISWASDASESSIPRHYVRTLTDIVRTGDSEQVSCGKTVDAPAGTVVETELPPLVGAEVEAFWPADETWLPAVVVGRLIAGTSMLRIAWTLDGTQSDVPLEYVKHRGCPAHE